MIPGEMQVAEGTIELKLPAGWRSEPAQANFHRTAAGDTDPILFSVTPAATETGAYSIKAVAHSGGRTYESGWHSVGYAGLRPYNQYKPAELETRKIEVKLAPGLRIGYVMGTGDLVPDAIEGMGISPTFLSAADLTSGNLSEYNVIVIGIRAYSVRPELARVQSRLDEFVRKGGTVNFFGGCASGTKVQLDTNRLHYSEVTLKATFHHTPETVRKAFALIAEKKIRSTDYITGEAPLSRLQQVLRHMLNRNGDIKTAIIPGH